MLKHSFVLCICVAGVGCASGGGGGGATTSSNYDKRVQAMIGSTKGPLDEAALEGVWNDSSDSAIAIVHKEGDEYRLLLAIGDTRPNIPLTTFEATNMGNPLPDDQARARATEALKSWKNGTPTPKDRFLFAMSGKKNGDSIVGSWSDGNGECSSDHWGNFYFQMNRSKEGEPVLYMSVYATAKKIGPGMGGQKFEFGRYIYFGKAKNPAPPSILENLQKTENFCRKTAE